MASEVKDLGLWKLFRDSIESRLTPDENMGMIKLRGYLLHFIVYVWKRREL